MTEWQFDQETAISRNGDGRWTTHLHPAWNIGDNPNGGYAAAATLRALASLAERPDPIPVTTHYLRPGLAEQTGSIDTTLVKPGRRAVNVTGTLTQDGKERLRVMAAFADLAAADPSRHELSLPPTSLPAPEQCRDRKTLAQGVKLPLTSRLDIRIHPELAEPGEAGRAEVSGWVRFADGRPPDALALTLFADAFPPSLFGLLGSVGWVPTLELTVHVRRRPAPGWIAARFRTRDLSNGLMVEDGELWDETGALVARSRQLALLLAG
ncbi:MAG: thioesterase family protein [Ectothiorhodospiraceae bacterium]|nr:thioesterase family protein [Ectothiorhodospiraceae bacterium]